MKAMKNGSVLQNLSEQDLENILVERHSAAIKKNTNWSVTTFKGNILDVFVTLSFFLSFFLFFLMFNLTKKRDNEFHMSYQQFNQT